MPKTNPLKSAADGLYRAVSSLVDRLGALGVEVNHPKEAKRSSSPARLGKRGANAKLVSVWASYTPKERAARIAAMRAGHAKRKRRMAGRRTHTASLGQA